MHRAAIEHEVMVVEQSSETTERPAVRAQPRIRQPVPRVAPSPEPRSVPVASGQRPRLAVGLRPVADAPSRTWAELTMRSEQIAAQLKRREPKAAATPDAGRRGLVEEALRLVAEKRYDAAIERLELALQRTPSPRLRVLLCVVQARRAITERDFSRARACYEAVLELDPSNEVAQRELLMLWAVLCRSPA